MSLRILPVSAHPARVSLAGLLTCLLLTGSLFISSCATIQQDIQYEADRARLEVRDGLAELEMELVAIRAALSSSQAQLGLQSGGSDVRAAALERLAAVDRTLAAQAAQPSTEPRHRARLAALRAEAALLGGDRETATRHLAASRAAYRGDELYHVVFSRMEDDLSRRAASLEEAKRSADSSYVIQAELGATLEALGRYRDAVSALDAALSRLDPAYASLYGPARERAWRLRDFGPQSSSDATAYLSTDQFPLIGLVTITRRQTRLLEWIDPGRNQDDQALFRLLAARGWFAGATQDPEGISTRKAAALFLWHLYTRDVPEKLWQYTERWKTREQSPVLDVAIQSPYFDAVLGLIEEGVLYLRQGRYFSGDDPISGQEFGQALLAVSKLLGLR